MLPNAVFEEGNVEVIPGENWCQGDSDAKDVGRLSYRKHMDTQPGNHYNILV